MTIAQTVRTFDTTLSLCRSVVDTETLFANFYLHYHMLHDAQSLPKYTMPKHLPYTSSLAKDTNFDTSCVDGAVCRKVTWGEGQEVSA